MLTQEENELLTKVGPGTPCGEMLRGLDPFGVVRDPELRMIDTNLTESMELERAGRPRGTEVATEETPGSRP